MLVLRTCRWAEGVERRSALASCVFCCRKECCGRDLLLSVCARARFSLSLSISDLIHRRRRHHHRPLARRERSAQVHGWPVDFHAIFPASLFSILRVRLPSFYFIRVFSSIAFTVSTSLMHPHGGCTSSPISATHSCANKVAAVHGNRHKDRLTRAARFFFLRLLLFPALL